MDRYVFLEDRGIVTVAGEDRIAFLQGLVSNDVARASPAHAVYSAFLTAQGKFLHDFFIPENARWSVLSNASKNIGEEIDAICKIIEKENPQLDGVLTSTKYNDKRKYPDDKLKQQIGRAHV